MKILNLFIPGEPKPKQSARFRAAKNKNGKTFVQSYQSEKIKDQERSIKAIVYEQLEPDFVLHEGPIVIPQLHYSFSPRKNEPKWYRELLEAGSFLPKTTKPDLTDNLNKGLFDALEGIVYRNDSQICIIGKVAKFYSLRPGIKIKLALFDTEKELIFSPMFRPNMSNPVKRLQDGR